MSEKNTSDTMAYPNTYDSFLGTTAQGTSALTSPDHALDHRTLGSALSSVEHTLGTNPGGTEILKNFVAGDFASRINSSNVLQQTLQGTINNSILGTPTVTGGTATSITLGTPTADVINARNSGTALGFGNSIYPAEGTVADAAGGTLTVNAQAAQIYYCAMGTAAGNRTIGTPTNLSSYQQLTYAFKASGSANGTLVWAGIFRFSQDSGTPAIGTGTTWNYYGWRYNAIDSKLDFMGQSKNII